MIATLLACAIAAQPAPTTEITPELLLLAVQQTYINNPTEERITLTRTINQRRTKTNEYTVRIDPRTNDADPTLRLELDELTIHAADGTLRAVHDNYASTIYEHPYEPPLTTAALNHLPPLIVPQLALIETGLEPITWQPSPFTPNVEWIQVIDNDAILTLIGKTDDTGIQVDVDERTDRITKIRFARNDVEIKLDIKPAKPLRKSRWPIERGTRELVTSIHELTTRVTLKTGDPIPDLLLFAPDGTPIQWQLTAHDTLLITRRRFSTDKQLDEFITLINGLTHPPRLIIVEENRTQAQDLLRRLTERAVNAAWSPTRNASIQRFDPKAKTLAAILDDQTNLYATLILDDLDTGASTTLINNMRRTE